jgi:hypothetical protein
MSEKTKTPKAKPKDPIDMTVEELAAREGELAAAIASMTKQSGEESEALKAIRKKHAAEIERYHKSEAARLARLHEELGYVRKVSTLMQQARQQAAPVAGYTQSRGQA